MIKPMPLLAYRPTGVTTLKCDLYTWHNSCVLFHQDEFAN